MQKLNCKICFLYLSQRVPPMRINDLIEDLKDGTKLLALLEVLSGERLQVEKGRNLRRPHFLSNANTALRFLTNKKIKLVNINASDLVDGRPPVVLGLIWTIILYFQIEENTRALESLGHTFGGSTSSLESMSEKKPRLSATSKVNKIGAKRALLQWVANALPKNLNVEVKDFGPSWRDGIAFLGVIEAIRAGLIDFETLKEATNRHRLETAFDVAENELGVARLLDPEDVDVDRPDERSIMTYVAQFLHKYPEPNTDAQANVQNEHTALLNWLLETTRYLQQLKETNTLPNDYNEFLKSKSEAVEKAKVYEKFGKIVDSQSIISISLDSWREMEKLWLLLEHLLRYWEWLLDSKLQGLLGEIVDWLGRAENMIYGDEIPQVMNEETARIISQKLEEHKAFFADLPKVVEKFETCKKTCDLRGVPPEQLRNIQNRIDSIGTRAVRRRIKLKYYEHKCCLIAFLHLTETKLKNWAIKYGREDNVQQLLDQYKNFVSRNKIFQEFNKAFIDMQQVVEEYKREGDVDERESLAIDQFMRNTADRWRSVSMELRCVQSMLEEVLAYWKRWNFSVDEFENWLEKASAIRNQPEEEKMEFFQDLSVWKDKHQQLNDTVSFLIATCEDPIPAELRDKYGRMNALWEQLFPTYKQYMKAGDMYKHKKDYTQGLEKLQKWLRGAEATLSKTPAGSSEAIKAYGDELKKLSIEIEEMEELFKNISKKFQGLIPDLPRDEVDKIMNTLKKEKESLVRIRASIPNQITLYHQILVQQESLEVGQSELKNWLEKADELLSSYRFPSNLNELRDILNKHKQFFGRTLYYRSMLDSKNKVYQNIVKNIDVGGGLVPSEMAANMKEINEKFESTTDLAAHWDQKLTNALHYWEEFLKNKELITDWLDKAENLLKETQVDTKQGIDQRKKFFQQINENTFRNLVMTEKELRNYIPPESQPTLQATVDQLEKRWKNVIEFAPLYLLKTEFKQDEDLLHGYLADINKEINLQQTALDRGDDVTKLASRSQQYLNNGKPIIEGEKCLENLGKVSSMYTNRKPSDTSLKEAYEKDQLQWTSTMANMKRLQAHLEQVPEKWIKYREQFQDMVKWMDKVDGNIKNLLKNTSTFEDFEKERLKFQTVCQEVESKREAVKWMVENLDNLTCGRSDPMAEKEQKLLEGLIARYKALIPTIEMTVTQTELFTKCFTYRKEATEVCNLLKRVGETSEATPHPETLNAIDQMIIQQEMAVSNLDTQRGNIISMIQRGKELAKDPHAPPFVSEQVNSLEGKWNKAYNATLDKLNNLKTTQKTWQNYKDQKKEIIELLEKAEQELKKMRGKPSSRDVVHELRDKQELSKALRMATEELLKRLKELCQTLSSLTAPERKPLFFKEVADVEKRLNTTLETVEKRVIFLEKLNTDWGKFNSDLYELRDWTTHQAPVLVQALNVEETEPHERLNNAKVLQRTLVEKIDVTKNLQTKCDELTEGGDANPESQMLKDEITSLGRSLKILKHSTDESEKAIVTAIEVYQKHKSAANMLKPWLEKAQLQTSSVPKPVTLKDIEDQLQQAKVFQTECAKQYSQLQDLPSITKDVPVTTIDEVGSLRAKCEVIKTKADYQVERCEKTAKAFEDFEKLIKHLEGWQTEMDKNMKTTLENIEQGDPQTWEGELGKLKILNREILTKQADLAKVKNASDDLCQGLALEGSNLVKTRFQDLKEKVMKLGDIGQQQVNLLSDKLIERQDFDTKLDGFNGWMNDFDNRVKLIENVGFTFHDVNAQEVHNLLQDHNDKLSVLNNLIDQYNSMLSKTTPKEAKELEKSSKKMIAHYKELEDNLQNKKHALEGWTEFLAFHDDVAEQLKYATTTSQDSDSRLDTVGSLLQELNLIKSKIGTWKEPCTKIDSICQKNNVTVKDQTGSPVTSNQLISKMEKNVQDVSGKLKQRQDALQAVRSRRNEFVNLQKKLSDDLTKTQEDLIEVLRSVTTGQTLKPALDKLQILAKKQENNVATKNKVHTEGSALMTDDQSCIEPVQNFLTSVDSEWDKTDDILNVQQKRLTDMIDAWDKLKQMKTDFTRELEEITAVMSDKNQPSDVKSNLIKAKKCLEQLKKLKNNFNMMTNKANFIIKQTENFINFDVNELEELLKTCQEEWKAACDDIVQQIQDLDAQNVLWEQMDDEKNVILAWIKYTTDNFNTSLKNSEQVQGKLAKYYSDLPTYENLKLSIIAKADQLKKLHGDKNPEPLTQFVEKLNDEFDMLKMAAKNLQDMASSFGDQEQTVRKEIKNAGDLITNIREAVISCDDLTGDNNQILERLNKVQSYQKDLYGFSKVLEQVNKTLRELKKEFPNFADSNLVKELVNLEKRYENVGSHANKVENNLRAYLIKYCKDRFLMFERILKNMNEKLQWCLPEENLDRYNLTLKLSSLKEIETAIEDCGNKKSELDRCLKLLEKVEDKKHVEELTKQKKKLIENLDGLKKTCQEYGDKLKAGSELWEKYDLMFENVSSWLKENEAKIRSESYNQVDVKEISQKIKETEEFQRKIALLEPEINHLTKLSETISKESPESRAKQHCTYLDTRYQAIVKFISSYLERLEKTQNNQSSYNDSIRVVRQWLKDSDEKLKAIEDNIQKAPKSLSGFQSQVDEVKKFEETKEKGQTLLNNAIEKGEVLFLGILPENREAIRAELRMLRDAAEVLFDRANNINKRIDTMLMQRSSIDDSYSQIARWLEEAQAKVEPAYEPKATLQEKKVAVQAYKTIFQDIASHKNMLGQLQEKLSSLPDEESSKKLDVMLDEYNNLIKSIELKIKLAENDVASHEKFLLLLEKFHDWLETLKTEAAPIVFSGDAEKEGAVVRLEFIGNLLRQKPEGDQMLEACKANISEALKGTSPAGQPSLKKELEDENKSWQEFLKKCTEIQDNLNQFCNRFTELEGKVDDLVNWIKSQELQVKDQSLKSTVESKVQHLNKLKSLENDILKKGKEFTKVIDDTKDVERDSELVGKVSKLSARYQALKNTTKETIGKYETYAEEHKAFNDNYAKFENWLAETEKAIQSNSGVVGDVNLLQEKQKKLRELSDLRAKESTTFDHLLDSGEKLYAHTSPDGREIIRQQLKSIRTKWDTLGAGIQSTIEKLDDCLVQFADFSLKQEELTNWLKDIEKAMQQHTELKNSLQEKRAQLQNHRIIHQEISAHQNLVDGVCEKAKRLVAQTKDTSLNVYLQSIGKLFQDIVTQSRALLESLEKNVENDTKFSDQCKDLRDWLTLEKEKLQECSDTNGERADIEKRAANIGGLQSDLKEGRKKVDEVKATFEVVAKSTAPKGVATTKKEMEDLVEGFQQHTNEIGNIENKLKTALKDWDDFNRLLNEHSKWFKDLEVVFREEKLCGSLAEKEAQSVHFNEKRNEVTQYEGKIDEFVDKGHALLNTTGAERVKPLISQISNRYQLLHVLSKEVVNRWKGLVDDHKAYSDKLKETEEWMKPLEDRLKKVLKDSNLEAKSNKLDVLSSQREQAPHKLTTLSTMAEKLYPETSAPGREQIRNSLRALRDRWDKLEEGILEQQKKQDKASQQWASYQETLNQTLSWITQMEAGLVPDQGSLLSIQEIRSRLLKNKTSLQEVLAHKRIIENLKDKANSMKDAPMHNQITETVDSISKKYENLVNAYQKNISQMEESLSSFQSFNDLLKSYQDKQKQFWDLLSGCSDLSGNKAALEEQLNKLKEITSKLPESEALLESLGKHVGEKNENLPARAKEAMERDLNNLKYDQNLLNSKINDIKHGLEERLKLWKDHEDNMEALLSWLSETEGVLKNYTPKSTFSEKQEQLDKYQDLCQDIDTHNLQVSEFLTLADHLEQTLLVSLRQREPDFDKTTDVSSELAQTSGDSRVSANVQQVVSRFKTVQSTAKDIVKKCQEAVEDHKNYLDKYKQCSDLLTAATSRFEKLKSHPESIPSELSTKITGLKELLSEQPNAILLVNTTMEVGEKLYPQTGMEGRDIVRKQLEGLQNALEILFDGVTSTERELQTKLTRWTSFEDTTKQLVQWLTDMEKALPADLELKCTLDEKRAMLSAFRSLLHDINTRKQDFVALKSQLEALPEKNKKAEEEFKKINDRHAAILKKSGDVVERYEDIVSSHQRYSKAVMDLQEWFEATHNTLQMWGDADLEKISLITNLERLKNLEKTLPDEKHKIDEIRQLADKVLPGTSKPGQVNVRTQVDDSQQEWESLTSTIKSTIEALENKLHQWTEYEQLKDHCVSWLKETDTKLHSVDLKATLKEKRDQLEFLKKLQGEVRAKELEIDSATEKALQLSKVRNSVTAELGIKYQQLSHKIKEFTTCWQHYVSTHQDLDAKANECLQWLDEIRKKLNYCSDLSAGSQKDLETKLETIQDLLLYKEEGFSKIQGIVELAQAVLANTAPSGHKKINDLLAQLQDEWSTLALKMVEIKTNLDDSIHRWAGFLEQIQELNKTVDYLESRCNDLLPFETTMSEKRANLDKIKNLEEKARCEKVEVDGLKAKAKEMLASGQQGQAASQAKEILDRFDVIAEKIKKLLEERDDQYKDHRVYKEAHDDLVGWLNRAREKVPSMKQRSLSDKLAIEQAVASLDSLLKKQAPGELLVEHLQTTGEVTLASTSPQGQESIKKEVTALTESFHGLFKDINVLKEQLEVMVVQWRSFKEEYERLSDWLQQIDILVKAQKIAMVSTVEEKKKQVEEVKDILDRLEKGQSQIDQFNETTSSLLKSHLDTYVSNQLRHLNSRYQVQVNLAKDVLKKVEINYEQHVEYQKNYREARHWIDKAKEAIRGSSENANSSASKEELQARLNQIKDLLKNIEKGQNMIHSTVNCGEKVLRNTKSDGRDVINTQLKDLQSDWDRFIRKLSTAKVHLETALLQWADYNSSYSQLQQWITDREAKLQEVCEQKVVKAKKGQTSAGLSNLSLGERKATLRQTDSIVQDIVSFEPVIQSVTSKAEDLLQAQPASEISTKYETLSKQAKELYAKQKETVEQHQAFIDAGNDFVQWIRNAKERLGKCSDPTGDKENLTSKAAQLTILNADLPEGQSKLEKALAVAAQTCQIADAEDKEIIEEEVALLQEELDIYVESLSRIKQLVEAGIVRWNEYEDQYKEASDWLAQTEALVQGYNKLQDSLEEKKIVLEKFQIQLQTLFDWQKEMDRLNMKAQVLLETCADTRVSNAVTQITTKYNALLSLAKEVMRRLELHYQEHQQHSTLYQECQDWAERTRDKLNECAKPVNSLNDAQSKLQSVKALRQSLETGQNKLRYTLELKEKVILNTEKTGAAKIQEDTENLKAELDRLFIDVDELRVKLGNRVTQLEDLQKSLKMLKDWLDETESKAKGTEAVLNDLSEKKALLERFKVLQKDVNSHNDLVDKVKAKFSDDPQSGGKDLEETIKRFNNLKELIGKRIDALECEVMEHEKYKQAYVDAVDWVRKTRSEVQQNSDSHGEKEETLKKKNKLNEIIKNLPQGEALIDKANKLKEQPLKQSSPEGQDNIKQELNALRSDWDSLKSVLKDSDEALTKCISLWKEYAGTFKDMNDWLSDFKNRVKVEEDRGDNRKAADLKTLHNLLEEANNKKNVLEELNDRCENLMDMCACPWVRDNTVQLQGEYTQALTAIQSLLSRAEKKLSDYSKFNEVRKEFDKWLNDARGTVKECKGMGDEVEAKNKLEKIKMVIQNLPEGQLLLTKLQEVFTKAVESVSGEEQGSVRDVMTQLKASWDQLNKELTPLQAELKSVLTKWEDLRDGQNRFEKWLVATDQVLKEPYVTKGELGEMKTVAEKLKNVKGEIDQKGDELTKLSNDAKSLSELSKKSNHLKKIKELETRWTNLSKIHDTLKTSLDSEMTDYCAYHQQLQDIEKWLLQISFQLMAHNSLYITNHEQASEQIKQHKTLMEEIQKYQVNLNELKEKGKNQIERYKPSAPGVEGIINKQLKNVQDSYDSLLNTAGQIRTRLLESLAKFKEYEDTLELISKNLDVLEPLVLEEIDVTVNDIKSTQSHLNNSKDLSGKLQGEKTRLAGAIQACEAATACVSRPSSPLEATPPSTPEKELLIRARLDDLIDQLQIRITTLTETLLEMEKWKKERNSILQWITEQKSAVNDWKSKPAKLRLESSKQELNTMNALLPQIQDKRNKILTEIPSEDEGTEEPHLGDMLNTLEEELMAVIAKKERAQQITEDYRKNLADAHQWLDSIIKKMENLDKGSSPTLDCYQKLNGIHDLSNEINTQGNQRTEEVKKLANHVVDLVSNLDSQQVDEQIKSLERRHSDIFKRIQRKAQALESTKQGVENINQEIQQIRDWIKSKLDGLKTPEALGFNSKQVKDKIQALRSLVKEVDGKQVVIDSMDKRLNNLATELEPKEVGEIETALTSLTKEHCDLTTGLKGELDKLHNADSAREKFESDLETITNWMKNKYEQVNKIGAYAPLKSCDIQQQISENKALINDINKFGETTIADQEKLGNSFNKECTKADKKKLQDLMKNMKNEYIKLLQASDGKLENLNDILAKRKQFEDKLGKCEKWLDEAQLATANEIRSPNIAVVEEMLTNYEKLSKEAEDTGKEIIEVMEEANLMVPQLNDTDKLILQTQLNTAKDKHSRLLGVIKDRISSAMDILQKHRDAAHKIQESIKFLTRIQNEVKELNRPVGTKVEDVQNMIAAHHKILNDLKDHRGELDSLKGRDVSGLEDILTQHDALIKAVEDQISRLRQLLLLREQYVSLIQQITSFIAKYTEIVPAIEKEDKSVQEKIKKYDDVIHKIQECDALLALANDKGQQIAADGSATDRNTVTESLTSLKQQLQQLKRSVERQREIHEESLAAYGKLVQELDDILDALNSLESDVKGRPLLKREPETVDEEIQKHKELATTVGKYLNRIKEVQESAKGDEGLPGALQEKLSEGTTFLSTLPSELNERLKYLNNNRQMRVDYQHLKDKLNKWVADVDKMLQKDTTGANFDSLMKDLENHNIFFSCEPEILDLLSQIQHSGDKVWPSLSQNEQEELGRELQELNQLLRNTLNIAKSRRAQLEQDIEILNDFTKNRNKVNSVLSNTKVPDDGVDNMSKLHSDIKKLTQALNEMSNQTPELESLNEKGNEIIKRADATGKDKYKKELKKINEEWQKLCTDLEGRREALNNIAQLWEQFETYLQKFDSNLSKAEERVKLIETAVRSKSQEDEARNNLMELKTTLEKYDADLQNIDMSYKPVKTFLEHSNPESVKGIDEKIEKLTQKWKTLLEDINGKLTKLNEENEKLNKIRNQIQDYIKKLKDLEKYVRELYVYGENQEKAEIELNKLKGEVDKVVGDAKSFCTVNKEEYMKTQHFIPSDVIQEITALELFSESVNAAMDEKYREQLRFKTMRRDFAEDVSYVKNWIIKSEAIAKDKSSTPHIHKEKLQEIQTDILSATDRLHKAGKVGNTLVELSNDKTEEEIIRQTLSTLETELSQFKNLLNQLRQEIGDTLDAWERFMALHKIVVIWLTEKKAFLDESLQLENLNDVKRKLNDYSLGVKSCKTVGKNLSEMSKELEIIGSAYDVNDLPDKLTKLEEAKAEIEAEIMKRNALLYETNEEWEQCEKKLREVRSWLEKSRSSLDSPTFRKRPLRDQLATRENMLTDILVQKEKIAVSMEKLQVHFRSGITGDPMIVTDAQNILKDLDDVDKAAKEQVSNLQECISQLDKYQQEIHVLRQQIVLAEQKLRTVLDPVAFAQHPEKARLEEQK
ncbi:hypothetical protein RUM43_009828 [Polyplax serrata]|uniref:Calponin-homology (CH) domain-containing protein n=1 Tax=Polyplax serrata TaxID=468196 RepID=A0AAN8S9V6_POLSC